MKIITSTIGITATSSQTIFTLVIPRIAAIYHLGIWNLVSVVCYINAIMVQLTRKLANITLQSFILMAQQKVA